MTATVSPGSGLGKISAGMAQACVQYLAECHSLPASPFQVHRTSGWGSGEDREGLSLASRTVSHLGLHPAKSLKQPGSEACLWVLHCLLCSRGLLLPVAFVVGEEGEEVRWEHYFTSM